MYDNCFSSTLIKGHQNHNLNQVQIVPSYSPSSFLLFFLLKLAKEKKKGGKIPILFVFIMLFSLSSANPIKRKQYTPCKNIVLYFHDIIYNGMNAANATSSIVELHKVLI